MSVTSPATDGTKPKSAWISLQIFKCLRPADAVNQSVFVLFLASQILFHHHRYSNPRCCQTPTIHALSLCHYQHQTGIHRGLTLQHPLHSQPPSTSAIRRGCFAPSTMAR